jgi:hypothetical protein
MKASLLNSTAVEPPPVRQTPNPWGGELLGIIDHGDYIDTNLLVGGKVVLWRTKWYDDYAVTWNSAPTLQSPKPFRADGNRDGKAFIGMGFTMESAVQNLRDKAGGDTTAPKRPKK